ncbi:MAG: major capsid protein [Microviridae sp.]|nr:MAG: major capsid protein [Microviridae sp.]
MSKKNLFNTVKMTRPNKNAFDLSHDVKLSLNMGQLVPIMCTECVPGDKFNISCESLLRFAPLVSPVMHKMNVYMHYFFVPHRLVWPNWEKFITNTDGLPPAFPTVEITSGSYTPLCDYLGLPIPPPGAPAEFVNAIPFAAYQKIYNEYYRDQNLAISATDTLQDGLNDINNFRNLRKRAWEHDYFTSALPFAQKGNPVNLPIGVFPEDVPVYVNNGGTDTEFQGNPLNVDVIGQQSDDTPENELYAQTAGVATQATTINDLRRAFKLQEWLEKAARGGTRYVESILSHFGVKSSDKRLQRPEYITGTKSPVIISEVLNTTGTEDAPQGQMAGHGVSVTSGRYGSFFCEEHGYIIGIMSVMPNTAYQQGIPKHFTKTNDPFQYFWPSFAHIGEQPIENRELYAYQGDAAGSETFGYTPRYAEYKYENNRVAGDFRTNLDFWHMGRIFDAPPALNRTFVECDPTHRIFAVTDPSVQKLYAHVHNKITAVRPMPKFGTPTF